MLQYKRPRVHSTNDEFVVLSAGDEAHWEVVERILFIYGKLNPGQGYVQVTSRATCTTPNTRTNVIYSGFAFKFVTRTDNILALSVRVLVVSDIFVFKM